MRLVACVILSFICISIDHSHSHLSTVRKTLSAAIYPLQAAVYWPVKAGGGLVEHVRGRERLIADNDRLREENLMLRSKAQRFSALQKENRRLRELLDSSAQLDQEFGVADIVAIQATAGSRQMVINKGTRSQVFLGQPLIDAYGVIGQVAEVGPFSSTAILITDPKHALPVQVNRSGLQAIAVGVDRKDGLELQYVPANADVRIGDLVVTSGLGQRFPAGFPVGEVTAVDEPQGDAFSNIVVTPSAQIGRGSEVLLVWPRSEIEGGRMSAVTDIRH